jgi:outer membrane protein OmpA-like peptidoglycan-associated protein
MSGLGSSSRLTLLPLVLALACASAPRPQVLVAVDATEKSPAVLQARTEAPQAFARAAALKRDADAAHDAGDAAVAQILGEQALAAYQRAVTLAGITRAESRAAAAEVGLTRTKAALAQAEQTQKQLDADTTALELRLKVARETLPTPVSGPPASPERELARREAARALVAQARLLCSASRMLDPKRATLEPQFKRIGELEAALASKAMTPIDDARAVRSACLAELTATRRPRTQANPADPSTDALLKELSQASLVPSRDDRGVVVTLGAPFERDDKLTSQAATRLGELAGVAKAHPDYPVMVVVHSAAKLPEAREATRTERAASALRERGAPKVETASVGMALPRVDPKEPGAAARNDRVEVVFVAPTAS